MHCKLLHLMDLLEAARPYVADCVDVIDGEDGQPVAGPAMLLDREIGNALAECDELFQRECETTEIDLADLIASDAPDDATAGPLWN